MNRHLTKLRIATVVLSICAIVLSSLAIAQIRRLHLPFPFAIAVLDLIVPIVALVTVFAPSISVKHQIRTVLTTVSTASIFVPFIFLVLSFVYGVPSDLLACSVERRWGQYFSAHDTAIRSIQDRLRCCGYNSRRDRAWPFPHRDVDARACMLTLQYTVRCADLWLREQSRTAIMVGFASLLNFILLCSLTSRNDIPWPTISGLRRGQQGLLESNQRTDTAVHEATYEDEPRTR